MMLHFSISVISGTSKRWKVTRISGTDIYLVIIYPGLFGKLRNLWESTQRILFFCKTLQKVNTLQRLIETLLCSHYSWCRRSLIPWSTFYFKHRIVKKNFEFWIFNRYVERHIHCSCFFFMPQIFIKIKKIVLKTCQLTWHTFSFLAPFPVDVRLTNLISLSRKFLIMSRVNQHWPMF